MEVLMGPTLRIDRVRSDLDSGIDEEESSDSSIGAPDDSEEEDEEVEEEERDDEHDDGGGASSDKGKLRKGSGSLGNLASLEDSLPIKRGLSLHISGKSKSFTNLAEASIGTVKDLEKTEHPFNKKRRMLRWSRNNFSGYYKWSNPRSMPVLPLIEDEEDDDDERDEEGGDHNNNRSPDMDPSSPGSKQRHRHRVLKSRSCFALADLPEEEDDDD
ncbi:guanine nucleotide-binding protein-like 3 homolog [Punica granatum]|uniref:Uncharacterized protein n=2 Tax=Punica granatum TaxID=22663 RepID=A0A218WYX3_PUNGR|nr:guanine nucleotide-binding protein-like 3 homolog [Punica granatum]OWM77272.1 hypothetical protein CDL15_Pgr028909 [Punica granatum]PKI51845.1 hypothetical protein CRG98_027763 [Punica granatum]